VVRQVGGHLHHAAGIAGGADAAAFARECDEALGGTRVAAHAGEAVGEDAAAEVGAEIVLDPLRDSGAIGVGRCCVGEEGLEVVLDERVEGCGCGITAATDGGEAVRPRRCLRLREGATGRGPPGAGRRGRGHTDDGVAAGGATEWRGGLTPLATISYQSPTALRHEQGRVTARVTAESRMSP
jgi:hypothetical protein